MDRIPQSDLEQVQYDHHGGETPLQIAKEQQPYGDHGVAQKTTSRRVLRLSECFFWTRRKIGDLLGSSCQIHVVLTVVNNQGTVNDSRLILKRVLFVRTYVTTS